MDEEQHRIMSPDEKLASGLKRIDKAIPWGRPVSLDESLDQFVANAEEAEENAESCHLAESLRAYKRLALHQRRLLGETEDRLAVGEITRKEQLEILQATDDVSTAMADVIVDRFIRKCSCQNK